MIETDMDAFTPMLRRYSMWIGETARKPLIVRSSGSPLGLIAGMIGTVGSSTSEMIRNMLREYTIEMTQDQLAQMLGVGRSCISRVIGTMKSEGIITVSRKNIEINDHDKIKATACDCNENVRDHVGRVLRGVYPDDAD
ncbi:MAG: helix-turn-helix domain-containing protein [Novosphingobium sp.]